MAIKSPESDEKFRIRVFSEQTRDFVCGFPRIEYDQDEDGVTSYFFPFNNQVDESTDMEDKNQKEIFENDIVKVPGHNEFGLIEWDIGHGNWSVYFFYGDDEYGHGEQECIYDGDAYGDGDDLQRDGCALNTRNFEVLGNLWKNRYLIPHYNR
jgi:uncharacterized phage protein (TIGR01671 family)